MGTINVAAGLPSSLSISGWKITSSAGVNTYTSIDGKQSLVVSYDASYVVTSIVYKPAVALNLVGFSTGNLAITLQTLMANSADIMPTLTSLGDIIYGSASNDTIRAGNGSDTIYGNAGHDNLFGDAGDDTLVGGAGGDLLDGGSGIDTASYAGLGAVVVDMLAPNANTGDAAFDSYVSIENITGGAGNDRLAGDNYANVINGGAGTNIIYGNGGNDTLIGSTVANANSVYVSGGDGNDRLSSGATTGYLYGDGGDDTLSGDGTYLDGGTGYDLLTYEFSTKGGVTVDLNSGRGRGGDAEGDQYFGIEQVIGTSGNDTLIAGAGYGYLQGGGGNDVLMGSVVGSNGAGMISGGDGNDIIDGGTGRYQLNGGNGTDTISFQGSRVGVLLDLDTGASNTTSGFFSFENIMGSAYNDTLTGTNANNVIDGNFGNDTIFALNGNDVITSGSGDDVVWAGLGSDRVTCGDGNDKIGLGDKDNSVDDFYYKVNEGADTVYQFESKRDVIHLTDVLAYMTKAELQAHTYYNSAAGGTEINIVVNLTSNPTEIGSIFLSGVSSIDWSHDIVFA